MPRCPDCNHFVPVEAGEPEPDLSLDVINGEIFVTGEVRLVKTCGECGMDLEDLNLEVENYVDELEVDQAGHTRQESCEPEIISTEAETFERQEGKGRPRTYYGADLTLKIKCSCGWETEKKIKVEETAGSFESCC